MGCGTIALLAGLGLDAGGAAMGSSAAGAEQKGMNNAIDANIQQMNKYQRQGQGLLNQGIAGFQPGAVQKDIQQGQGQFLNAANQATATGLGGQQTLSGVNQQNTAARAGMGNQAMSQFAGYSNVPQQWGLQNKQLWPQLGVINAQAANRNALLPALLQIASRSQQGRSSAGGLIAGLGSLLSGVSSLSSLGNLSTGNNNPDLSLTGDSSGGIGGATGSSILSGLF